MSQAAQRVTLPLGRVSGRPVLMADKAVPISNQVLLWGERGEPGEGTLLSGPPPHSLPASGPRGTHDVQVAKLEMNWALRTSFRRENKTPHRKHVVHTVATDTQKGSALLFRETQIRAAIRYPFHPTYWQQLKGDKTAAGKEAKEKSPSLI